MVHYKQLIQPKAFKVTSLLRNILQVCFHLTTNLDDVNDDVNESLAEGSRAINCI